MVSFLVENAVSALEKPGFVNALFSCGRNFPYSSLHPSFKTLGDAKAGGVELSVL